MFVWSILLVALALVQTGAFAPRAGWVSGTKGVSMRKLAMSSDPAPSEDLTIRQRLSADMKSAMKAKEKTRLGAIRAIQAAIKQKEVDDRVEVDDALALEIMSKLVKQRKESIKSYTDGGRQDLADTEQEECDVIAVYMPRQLSAEEVDGIIAATIVKVGATTVKDMGK
ncbi:Yqey-like protein-domain-containing protein, partial [Ochromonadaceae sp. CCMP2298]